jgi:hypothetical protein
LVSLINPATATTKNKISCRVKVVFNTKTCHKYQKIPIIPKNYHKCHAKTINTIKIPKMPKYTKKYTRLEVRKILPKICSKIPHEKMTKFIKNSNFLPNYSNYLSKNGKIKTVIQK